ncbi:MAG: helix-turn-helix transcriptional regulator [Syntrophus sp. (in: bacteria)]
MNVYVEINADLKRFIGLRIGDIRRKKGITQEYLAGKMDIDPKYLSSIERGKENPTLNTLIKLSQALDVDLGEIFAVVQIEDVTKRKNLVLSLINEADGEQLKQAYKILAAILR